MILSIESSCDDSSLALTQIDTKKIIFHKKISQEEEHAAYGGVVPELAARLHAQALPNILKECKPYFKDLKAVAVTSEPGLSVTLMEGVTMAKALCISLNLPLISVNHLKGHIYSLFLEQEEQLPCTVLLVSGGHTQIIDVQSLEDMSIVASTMDDSFGESFDKVAKMLGLGYPGGPIVQEYALKGDESKYDFPVPLRQSSQIAFSYSGLKNAVRMAIEKEQNITNEVRANICASFQKAAVAHIMQKTKKYFSTNPVHRFAIVGGASANIKLRGEIEQLCKKFNCALLLAPLEYCSDNAAMIGRVALEQYAKNDFVGIDQIDVKSKIKGF
ncbi:MAG: tRNA (adenosine(37)-N6)-threonylcarbamoyltransferase complex transferase subunit TsaD [Campylobacterota bacterium]|nr:tRNA (adenosine(37)-N6)-threonylcarbamoyltransferase complex transferase subunit TsaD [Campylobacterota bacterium]